MAAPLPQPWNIGPPPQNPGPHIHTFPGDKHQYPVYFDPDQPMDGNIKWETIINEDSEHTFKAKVNNKEMKKAVKNLMQFRAVYMKDVDDNQVIPLLKNGDRIAKTDLEPFFQWCNLDKFRTEVKSKQTYSFLAQIMSCQKYTTETSNAKNAFYAVVYDKTPEYYRQYSVRLNANQSLRHFEAKCLVVTNDNRLEAFNNWPPNYVAHQPNIDFRAFVVGQNGYLVFCQTDASGHSDPILLTEYQYLIFPHRQNDHNIVYRRLFNTQRRNEPKELFLRETIISRNDGMAVSQAIIQRQTGGDGSYIVTGIINAVLDMSYLRAMMETPLNPVTNLYDRTAKKYYPGEAPDARIPEEPAQPPNNPPIGPPPGFQPNP